MDYIIHHNDLDGRGAGAIIYDTYRYTPDQVKTFEVDYRVFPNIVDEVASDSLVYIVDYSFTEDTVDKLIELCKKCTGVVWLDHHKSSAELLKTDYIKDIDNYCFHYCIDQSKSGTYLAWEYTNPNTLYIPNWVRYIDDYDRFCGELKPESLLFKYGMDVEDTSLQSGVWFRLLHKSKNPMNIYNDYADDIISNGRKIELYNKIQDKFYLETYGFTSVIEGHECLVLNKRCNSLAFGEEFEKVPCVVSMVFDGALYTYSVFSSMNSDVNCESIARKYQGGGHQHAAGFQISENIFA